MANDAEDRFIRSMLDYLGDHYDAELAASRVEVDRYLQDLRTTVAQAEADFKAKAPDRAASIQEAVKRGYYGGPQDVHQQGAQDAPVLPGPGTPSAGGPTPPDELPDFGSMTVEQFAGIRQQYIGPGAAL